MKEVDKVRSQVLLVYYDDGKKYKRAFYNLDAIIILPSKIKNSNPFQTMGNEDN